MYQAHRNQLLLTSSRMKPPQGLHSMACSPSSDFPFPIPPFPVSFTLSSVLLLLVAHSPFLPILSYLTPLPVPIPVPPSLFLKSWLPFFLLLCQSPTQRHHVLPFLPWLALPWNNPGARLCPHLMRLLTFIPRTHQQDDQCSHHALIHVWESPGGTQVAPCKSGV